MDDVLITKKFIEATPEAVFAAATDFPRAAEVIRGIEKIEMLTDGPIGEGTRFRETRILFKREATEEMEITSFEPPRKYTLGCESHGCRYETEVLFTPEGSGTAIEMRFQAIPLSFMAKMMAGAMKPMLGTVVKCIEEDLDDLKTALEGAS